MTTLLTALKTLAPVVPQAGLMPVLSSVALADGMVHASDGRVSMSLAADACPFALCVPYRPFVAALEAAGAGAKLAHVNDHLTVTSKGFRARLRTLPIESWPLSISPQSKRERVPEGFVAMLKVLRTFIATDATRPWANCVLIRESYMYATNNVSMVRCKVNLPTKFTCKLTQAAVEALCKIDFDPYRVCIDDQCVEFEIKNVTGGQQLVTLNCLQHSGDWPDVERMFDSAAKIPKLPVGLDDAVITLARLTDALTPVLVMEGKTISTTEGGDVHAQIDLAKELPAGRYALKPLTDVVSIATHIDLARYPLPVPFRGNTFEGLLVGVR